MFCLEPSQSGPVAGTWPARVRLFFTVLTFTHYEFQYNGWSSTVSYPFQARATDVANPCCSSNTPVTHPSFCRSFRFSAALKIWPAYNRCYSIQYGDRSTDRGRDGFSKISFPYCDVMCYRIKQRVESTWPHSYIRQAFLFIDQNFVYKVV